MVKILTVPGQKIQIEIEYMGVFSFVNVVCFHQYSDLDNY